jgi:hypothetical protein
MILIPGENRAAEQQEAHQYEPNGILNGYQALTLLHDVIIKMQLGCQHKRNPNSAGCRRE